MDEKWTPFLVNGGENHDRYGVENQEQIGAKGENSEENSLQSDSFESIPSSFQTTISCG